MAVIHALSIALLGATVGLLVGLTGVGGGALLTPALITLGGLGPATAVATDLVAAIVLRPAAAAVHWRARVVERALVRRLALGAVPGVVLGTIVLHLLGATSPTMLTHVVGGALLLGGSAALMRPRHAPGRRALPDPLRTTLTVAAGLVGGLLVGATSIGAGSMTGAALLLLYPGLGAAALVGTDLVVAVPVGLLAAVAAVTGDHVDWPVAVALAAGGLPGALLGARLATRSTERWGRLLRRAVAVIIVVTGARYLGAPLSAAAVVAGGLALIGRRSVAEAVERVRAPLPVRFDDDA